MDFNFKLNSKSPRVNRSEHVSQVYIISGQTFEDGKDRYIVPSYFFTDDDAEILTNAIEQRELADETLNSLLKMINSRWL